MVRASTTRRFCWLDTRVVVALRVVVSGFLGSIIVTDEAVVVFAVH